jgi:hypothetical protein
MYFLWKFIQWTVIQWTVIQWTFIVWVFVHWKNTHTSFFQNQQPKEPGQNARDPGQTQETLS